jgi:hypothetical protein
MLATFCLRLACGMTVALLLLPPAVVNSRFYRVQFLTVLGLTTLAAAMIHMTGGASAWVWIAVGLATATAFAGSVAWSLENGPGGGVAIAITALASVAALLTASVWSRPTIPDPDFSRPAAASSVPLLVADELASAAVLGSAITAMLMGHSYLIAPSMSLTPLLRLVAALMIATLVRMGLAGIGLWSWSAGHSFDTLDETLLWLPVRWGVGFLAPLVLGWMAWQTTRIRSTQSATGILYVVVIFCFLGELTSQLLLRNTGYVL